MRANMESRLKGDRVGKTYETKRREATERLKQGRPFTRMLPAWLRWNDETKAIEADPQRAEVLRSIFKKASEGRGQHWIAHWLNEGGVPTFGGIGKQRRAEQWNRSYVKKLLSNRAVIGAFTPQQRMKDKDGKRKRKPLEAIEGYFPAAVDPEVFERVASRMKVTAARGRNAGADPASIFAGVLKCARCGGTVTRVAKGQERKDEGRRVIQLQALTTIFNLQRDLDGLGMTKAADCIGPAMDALIDSLDFTPEEIAEEAQRNSEKPFWGR